MSSGLIHVTLACESKYALGAWGSIFSSWKHCSRKDSLRYYLFTDQEEAPLIQRMVQRCTALGINLRLIDFTLPQVQLPTHGGMSVHAYFRLFMPEILGDLDEFLYIDSGLLIRGDFAQLPLGQKSQWLIQGIPDYLQTLGRTNPELCEATGQDPDEVYINSGFCIFNAREWRTSGAREICLRHLEEFPQFNKSYDQDAINYGLAGRIGKLDPRWNQFANLMDTYPKEQQDRVLVIHFVGKRKPWTIWFGSPVFAEYRRMIALSGLFSPPELLMWNAQLIARRVKFERSIVVYNKRKQRELRKVAA